MTRIPSETLQVYGCDTCHIIRTEAAVEGNPSCCNKSMYNTGWITQALERRSDEENQDCEED